MKTFISSIIILVVFAVAAIVCYKIYFPKVVAEAIVSNQEPPTYVPRYIKARINRYKVPVNESAEVIIKRMHESNITIDQLFKTIDETSEEQVYAMVDDLMYSKYSTTDEVFNIITKHL